MLNLTIQVISVRSVIKIRVIPRKTPNLRVTPNPDTGPLSNGHRGLGLGAVQANHRRGQNHGAQGQGQG